MNSIEFIQKWPDYLNEIREAIKPELIPILEEIAKTDCGYSIGSTMASITNVITTPAFNKSEWKDIDLDFTHDAPCPTKIYQIFIDAYTEVGDLVMDGFCGSSGGLDYALRKGRSVVGYDIDPVSIEFSKKRLEKCLAERKKNILSIAA